MTAQLLVNILRLPPVYPTKSILLMLLAHSIALIPIKQLADS